MSSSNCRVKASAKDYTNSQSTQFAATLTVLLHMQAVFPEWDGILVTDQGRWAPDCMNVYRIFEKLYSEGAQPNYKKELIILDIPASSIPVLRRLAQTGGKETDHSRGHWPVEAYMHLVAFRKLLSMGYDYGIYVDPDMFFFDRLLIEEIPKVQAIGCISAIPPQCLEPSEYRVHNKDIHQEYRLITEVPLLNEVRTAAQPYGGYTIRNATNSGLVIYNTRALADANWDEWLHTLFEISPKGFYGDQTALSVAYGRNDIHIHWLPPRFNVALSLPTPYIANICGADAKYSRHAVDGPSAGISSVHFIWGPKPWSPLMKRPHKLPRAGVQADLLFANSYRKFVRDTIPYDTAVELFGSTALLDINDTTTEMHKPAFRRCFTLPESPCLGGGERHGRIRQPTAPL